MKKVIDFNKLVNDLNDSALLRFYKKLSTTEEYTLIDIVYNELERRGLVEDYYAWDES